ncbi:MAG: sulfotransferase [Anaerolineae bacterium]|jgi:protein-tyrosine sulfotransferase|nr:sulfotransferase [Anaerolineae bacterium]
MGLRDDLVKYLNYMFDTRSFHPKADGPSISDHALEAARSIRGVTRAPALMLHGVMPRSGTVYVGELLRLHPDLAAYPNEIWELPFLKQAGEIRRLQKEFFFSYEQNIGKIGDGDFLPLFGSALIAYLHSFLPPEQRMLVKVPGVQYLTDFFAVFPAENLLLLVRDGRDVVHSTLRTWPQLRFSMVCRRWRRAAEMILSFDSIHSGRQGYWLARYEDAVQDPAAFVQEACMRFGLEANRFPFEEIDTVAVHGSSSLKVEGKVVWDHVDRPKDFRPIGHWQNWSSGKKRTFKRIAGQALIDLGYCADLDW